MILKAKTFYSFFHENSFQEFSKVFLLFFQKLVFSIKNSKNKLRILLSNQIKKKKLYIAKRDQPADSEPQADLRRRWDSVQQ